MKFKSTNYTIAIVIAVLITISSLVVPFFWDTILTSKILIELEQKGFAEFLLPNHLDAGHPPLFYAYLYGFIKAFGLQIWVVHLAMFPFILLLTISFQFLLNYFNVKRKWSILYLFAIPAVSSQALLISYDFAMLALFISGICLILKNKNIWLSIIALLIVLFSLRGVFLVVSLYLIQVFWYKQYSFKQLIYNFKYYIISIIALGIWLLYHYGKMNYWISNATGWQTHRGVVDFNGFLSNIIGIARTQFDVGILILFSLNVFIWIKYKSLRKVQLFAIIPFIVLSLAFVLSSNPIGHRYYLVVYVLELLPILIWLKDKTLFAKLALYFLLLVGNFQIYPNNISNAWDCTLMHLFYHKQKQKLRAFIKTNKLNENKMATVFPIYPSEFQTHWIGDTAAAKNIHGQDINSERFIIWSNVANDFSNQQIRQLKSWKCIYQSKIVMVQIKLYQNPNKKQ